MVNGAGTIGAQNVTNVAVACVTDTRSVGRSAGLAGAVFVLQNNSGDNDRLGERPFTFAGRWRAARLLGHGAHTADRAAQTCTVASGTGTVGTPTSPTSRSPAPPLLHGRRNGERARRERLVLQNNAGDDHTASANGDLHLRDLVRATPPTR